MALHTHRNMHRHMHMHMHMHTHMHMHVHVHMRMHMHLHAHMHMSLALLARSAYSVGKICLQFYMEYNNKNGLRAPMALLGRFAYSFI